MERKMRVGIDFDDVIFNCNLALMQFHNEQYESSYTFEDITDFNLATLWGITPEEAHVIYAEFCKSHHHKMGVPVVGALNALQTLSNHTELFIVTGRLKATQHETEEWINKHCPGIFQEVIYTNHFGGSEEQRRTKGSVCSYLGLKAFVEDAPIHAESVVTTDTRLILLTKPWNKNFSHPKIERVHRWDEIPPIIMK